MVQFLPLDPRDADSIDLILQQVDNAIQYHEDVEPRTHDNEEGDEEREDHDGDIYTHHEGFEHND